MAKKRRVNKLYVVRLSPAKEDILYYGSFLFDKINMGGKVVIAISKGSEKHFIKKEEGHSFKILPRDFVPDYNLEFNKNKLRGSFPKAYSNGLVKDIKRLILFLKKTRREDLTIPVLFIISKRGVQYISLGL